MSRRRLMCASLALDVVALTVAYALAFFVRFDVRVVGRSSAAIAPDWSFVVVLAATLGSFLAFGLYKREAYLLRTLHVWTIVKATFVAFVATGLVVYLLKSPAVEQSRFVLVATFLGTGLLVIAFRLFVLTPVYFRRLQGHGETLVVTTPDQHEAIVGRLAAVRGFSRIRVIEPEGRDNGHRAFERVGAGVHAGGSRIENVFIDSTSLAPERLLALVDAAKCSGAEVYVASPLLSPLDSTRLLMELFEMPVMRVHVHPDERRVRPSKRAFDILGATLALVCLAPVMALIALAVKLTSPGPVLFTQQRVGLKGRRFPMHKFRSMVVNDDAASHREYVCKLIAGDLVCDPADEALLKLTADPRVTRVGALLRKFSLDELPQLWNVLRGDMSLVGPRPALDYEVDAYQQWHRERLEALPGLSGLWQVSGRSRVGFDDMVLEDVLYSYNQSLLTDVAICLRTIPVVVFGRGAA